jgi:hypothetical protein
VRARPSEIRVHQPRAPSADAAGSPPSSTTAAAAAAAAHAARAGAEAVMAGNPLERTSVQLLLFAAVVALFANSAVDRTDEALPWEITLTGLCVFAIVFIAIYTKKTEVALSVVSVLLLIVPTYYVHNYEVPCNNYELGSTYSVAATKAELLQGVFKQHPNASRFDRMFGLSSLGLSLSQFSLFPSGISLEANTTEIFHSGLQLDDPLTKEKTHDYLLISSPRKVQGEAVGIMLLARVPVRFDVWPKGVEDHTFNLQTASSVVAPPTFTGELVKLDKGPAIEHLKKKHHHKGTSLLRPFILDVYRVDYIYEH